MQELRTMLEKLNYYEVKTYIQSGNIVLKSSEEASEIEKTIKVGIADTFGYDVSVLVRTITAWEKAIANNPYTTVEEKQQYFTFLSETPEIKSFDIDAKADTYQIIDDIVYVNAVGGYGKTKLTNNLFEKKLNVTATTRNLKTTLKLLALAKEIN